ncbi:hypothetical protein PPYR_09195 [Photinus pyralis]|uniref:Uncharacterized protein n=2 Tax=Photinus pyralis TaxID=7054 RepID=A0A5N4ALI2_PHOPY|nr:hypothetical protein PPYR_09195 [Photinus pyralis]
MNSVDNLHLDSTPLSVRSLMHCKFDYPKRGNIEDGLCCPDDQKMFLTASMSFLQNHLARILNTDISSPVKEARPKRTYSDLLILESSPKCKRTKSYLRLKNIEKYDEISRNEASFFSPILTINQILPSAKKCAERRGIFGIFRRSFSTSGTKGLDEKMRRAYDLLANQGSEETDSCLVSNRSNFKVAPDSRLLLVSSFIKPKGHGDDYDQKSMSKNMEMINTLTRTGAKTNIRQRAKSSNKEQRYNFLDANFTDELKFQYSSDLVC